MRESTVSRRFECRVARARQVLDTRRRAALKRLCTTTSETRSRSKHVLSARRANSGDISSTSSGSVVQQQESVSTSQSPPSALSSNSSMLSQLVFSLSVASVSGVSSRRVLARNAISSAACFILCKEVPKVLIRLFPN